MSITNRLSAYLDKKHIHYQLLNHSPSLNSLSSASNSNIPAAQLVKGVMLEEHNGNRIMAVLPTTHKVNLTTLNTKLHRQFHLMKEAAIYKLFADCEPGAIPPVADAYNIPKIYDEALMLQTHLYLEAGDHCSLIKLTRSEFAQLMQGARPMHFTHQVFH